jgi:hypothetical protein
MAADQVSVASLDSKVLSLFKCGDYLFRGGCGGVPAGSIRCRIGSARDTGGCFRIAGWRYPGYQAHHPRYRVGHIRDLRHPCFRCGTDPAMNPELHAGCRAALAAGLRARDTCTGDRYSPLNRRGYCPPGRFLRWTLSRPGSQDSPAARVA